VLLKYVDIISIPHFCAANMNGIFTRRT